MREFKEKLRNNRWPLFFAILIISVLAIRYYSNIRERNELAVKAGNWDKLMLVMKQIDENYVDSIKTSTVSEYQYLLKAPVKAEEDNGKSDFSGERMTCISLETYYKAAGKNIEASFYGVTSDSAYFENSQEFANADGAYFSEGLMKKLGLKVGDEVKFINPYNEKEYKVRVAGSYNYTAGLAVFMDQAKLNSMLSYDKNFFNGYLSNEELTFADERYVAAVITPEDLAKQAGSYTGQFLQRHLE